MQKSNSHKSILTYNIMGIPRLQKQTQFKLRFQKILNTIATLDIDVICLQEVPLNCISTLTDWAKEYRYSLSTIRDEEVQCITLYLENLIETSSLRLPNRVTSLDYHAVLTQFSWGAVVNCHLHHGEVNSATREHQCKFILNQYFQKKLKNIILCGDFNINFTQESLPKSFIEPLESCEDIIQKHLPKILTKCPLNPLNVKKKSSRLDGMFLINNHDLKVLNVMRTFDSSYAYSDHYGLLTTVKTQRL